MSSAGQRDGVARRIIISAFKILFPSSAERIQAFTDIVSAIEGLDEASLEARALPRRLEDASDRIAARLARIEEIEFPGLADTERALAIAGVEQALAALRPSADDIIRDAVTTEQLHAALEPAALLRWRSDQLSDDAQAYGRLFLTETAAYVSALVHDLPGSSSKVAWETYVNTKKLEAILERGIAGVVLPKFRPGLPQEISRFEAGYRSDITNTYKYTDLFGLNLPAELRRHLVDITYIRLRALPDDLAADTGGTGAPLEVDPKVDSAIGEVLNIRKKRDRSARILLTGSAGSGKTTISQWIAIAMAQRKLPEAMAAWTECVPLVTQLRYAFKSNVEPEYQDMIRAAMYRGPTVPGSWVADCLDEGNAVAIFDGFDELSEHDRFRALAWIDKLMSAHPKAHVVVTSRPDVLDNRWFRRREFVTLQLLPMDDDEAEECINRWFDALISGTSDAEKVIEYRQQHAKLSHDFQNRPTVRDLSETPLLCAMLCAFYAHKLSDAAPESRAELYERVVEALIYLRDQRKEVGENVAIGLTYKQKLLLLQGIAKEMTANSTTTIRIRPLRELRKHRLARPGSDARRDVQAATAQEIVAAQLRGMVNTHVQPREALAHLLDRSVVFYKVAENQAQFTHRSIQEFLAGWAYAYDEIEVLVDRVTQPDWRRIIVFAAGAPVQKSAASRLVSGILDRAGPAGPERREVLLLAAECITAAGHVDATVAARAEALIGDILPPRSQEEARALSGIGEELLTWLDGHSERSPDVISACIAAAAHIGGPAAVHTIAQYSTPDAAPAVVSALLRAWYEFEDAESYARQVLAGLPLRDQLLVVRTVDQLNAMRHVTGAHALCIKVTDDVADLSEVGDLPDLAELDCEGLPQLRSTRGLAGLRQLRRLNLGDKAMLLDIEDLTQLPNLEELHLRGAVALSPQDLARLGGSTSLRILVLDNCRQLYDFGFLSTLTNLRTLSLDGCYVSDLDFCASLTELRTIRVRSLPGVDDARRLRDCPNLRRLQITLSDTRRPSLSELGPQLREVELTGSVSVADLAALTPATGLRTLRADAVRDLVDLRAVPVFRHLTHLLLPRCRRLSWSTSALEGFDALEVLDLSGSMITNLDFLAGCGRLRRLYLNGCQRLTDISALGTLPLEHLSMEGGVPGVTEDMVDALKARSGGRLTVVHDPFPDPFEITDYIGA
ncbi:leucine-rich repeat domain-containing protein [Micromonospora auratinigra]|uniref:NACHT domain-containing protein n=1 Tax=Micromonospora auratinigra TaxID=261654 RepID=A0A1A8ZJ01_9ACTN|nr:leucine-rich repeat domain-containing protein [Micromonospora auratinigra]SBT43857.1 NACHT domain-containing protein [Micromonospora auratinigra]